jgi:beta-glucosidase
MMRLLAPVLVFAIALPLFAQEQFQYPFQNPKLPAEKRIDNILSLMTIDEKIPIS